MTREEAREECERLNREHPERTTSSWLPRERRDGSWDIARVSIAAAGTLIATEVGGEERPPNADDPRVPMMRNVGPWAGGA
jgi:hypothetical protein